MLTALNLGYELMELKQGNQGEEDQLNEHLDGMIQQLDESLEVVKNK